VKSGVQILAALIAVVFVVAAISKVDAWATWRAFAADIGGPRLTRVVAPGVPLAEVVVAALAVLAPAIGLAAAAFTLAVFAVAVAMLVPRLGGAKCNCFGAASTSTLGWRLVARNGALSVGAAAAAVLAARWNVPRLPPGGIICALFITLAAFVAAEAFRFVRAGRPSAGASS
jgi:hypothetical protein